MCSVVLALILCQSAQDSNYGLSGLPFFQESKQQVALMSGGLYIGACRQNWVGGFNLLFLFIHTFKKIQQHTVTIFSQSHK